MFFVSVNLWEALLVTSNLEMYAFNSLWEMKYIQQLINFGFSISLEKVQKLVSSELRRRNGDDHPNLINYWDFLLNKMKMRDIKEMKENKRIFSDLDFPIQKKKSWCCCCCFSCVESRLFDQHILWTSKFCTKILAIETSFILFPKKHLRRIQNTSSI